MEEIANDRRVRPRLSKVGKGEARGGGDGGSGGGRGRRFAEAASTPSRSGAAIVATAASSPAPPPATMPSSTSLSSASSFAATLVAAMPRSGNQAYQRGFGEQHEGQMTEPNVAFVATPIGAGTTTTVLVSPRTNAFSSETWWMVDLEADPPQGATRLVKSCIRAYGWDSSKARSVLRAYRQFLFLKKNYKDYDAKKFSPSGTVDMMWHQHILDVVNYVHDCALLCGGRVMGHDPLGSAQGTERDERRKSTIQALLRHKDEIGIENEQWKELCLDQATGSPTECTIQLFVSPSGGKRTTIELWPDSGRVSDLFDAYSAAKGIPTDQLRFLSAGRPLEYDKNKSPRAAGLRNKSTVFVL